MNRKEREILDLVTGKIQLSEKEIQRREEKKLQQKKENRDKWMISVASLLGIIVIITGIVWFNSQQTRIAQKNVGFPPEVPAPSKAEAQAMENELVLLETTMGDIYFEVYPSAAPRTSRHIRELVKTGFYDGVVFHRIINDFMIQTGGFTTTEPKDPGFTFRDEINPLALDLPDDIINQLLTDGYHFDDELHSIRLDYGVLAMANAGPNTNSSQFFIVTMPDGTEWLNGKHTGFGRVVKGMDIVEMIQKVPTNEQDAPVDHVIITKASIISRSELEIQE
jgi:peptidyl-prolyl cis-trans isomerase-like 1